MRAIHFAQCGTKIAEHQEEYITLPAYYGQLGEHPHETGYVTCYELSDEEIENIKKYRKIWHTQLTFGDLMQPINMFIVNDFFNMDLDNAPGLRESIDLEELEEIRFAWSKKMFPDSDTQSALNHLKKEILEIEQNKTDVYEYADALMLLLDAARRSGIKVNNILQAFKDKHDINRSRTWIKNPDNSYSHKKGVEGC